MKRLVSTPVRFRAVQADDPEGCAARRPLLLAADATEAPHLPHQERAREHEQEQQKTALPPISDQPT